MINIFIFTAFVFCALLEFTVVNYMWRKLRPDILKNMLTERVNGGTAGSKSYDENIPSSPVIPVSVVIALILHYYFIMIYYSGTNYLIIIIIYY